MGSYLNYPNRGITICGTCGNDPPGGGVPGCGGDFPSGGPPGPPGQQGLEGPQGPQHPSGVGLCYICLVPNR